MLFKSPKVRQFSYQPIYYNPENEEKGSHIKFNKLRKPLNKSKSSNVKFFLIIIVIGLILFYFHQSQQSDNIRDIERIEIEDMR